MRLILETPALQAHSVLRYRQWRAVIAGYVADRLGQTSDDLIPAMTGQVSLALALTAYERWLASPEESMADQLEAAMAALKRHLAA
jgi:hypothetical protein